MNTQALTPQVELPKGWATARLGDLCSVIGGSTPSRAKPNYFGGNIVWLTPTEISKEKIEIINDSQEKLTHEGFENSSVRIIPKDSVLLTSRATIGAIAIAGCDVTTNQGFASFVCPPALFNFYLAYWLLAKKDMLYANAKGTTFKEISKSALREILIPLAPLPEQHRIVTKIEELFTRLDAGIDALKKAKLQLKQYRHSVLKHAFEGKLTGQWRQSNEVKLEHMIEEWEELRQAKYEHDCKQFLRELTPKKLPKIELADVGEDLPRGWLAPTIESSCAFVVDCPHSTPNFLDDGEYCIDTTCIEQSRIIWDRARRVSAEEFQERIKRMPPVENDILFSREGTIGTSVLVPKGAKICLGQRIMMFRFAPFVLPHYAELFLQSPSFIRQYRPLILGTNSPHLNVKDIKKSHMLIPPVDEQHRILEVLSYHLSLIENTQDVLSLELIHANKLRQSILNAAFAGRVVEQDSADEPATILVQRIQSEKAKQQSKEITATKSKIRVKVVKQARLTK